MPRTGIPEEYVSFGEYERHLSALVQTGVIEDGTKLWWDIRPSARFPTLEMRICDICTDMNDGLTIAAHYVCVLRMLWRLKLRNVTWRRYKTMLINENRWRAMRYGCDSGLIDFGRMEMMAYTELLDEVLDMIRPDAEALGCLAEVEGARQILRRGTSAHNQLRIYREGIEEGLPERRALERVVKVAGRNHPGEYVIAAARLASALVVQWRHPISEFFTIAAVQGRE